jgi:hypothetical protein
MTPDQFDELVNDEIIRKRLVKWMARLCFRENTELESFYDRISEHRCAWRPFTPPYPKGGV